MIHVTDGARMAGWLEDAWLQRYLERQLDTGEESWFEAYVMDKGELLERIDADVQVRDALARAGAADTQVPMPSSNVRAANRASPKAAPAGGHSGWWHPVGVAAILLAGVGLGWVVKLSVGSQTPSLIASPQRIVFDTERGEPMAPRIEHADSGSPYVLIEVPVPSGATGAVLEIGGSMSRELAPSADGFVSLLIERRLYERARSAILSYELEQHVRKRQLWTRAEQ